MPASSFVPPAPYRPGHVQNTALIRASVAQNASAAVSAQPTVLARPPRVPVRTYPPATTYQQPVQTRRPPVPQVRSIVTQDTDSDLEIAVPSAQIKSGVTFSQGCLIGVLGLAVLGGVGVGGWKLAEYLKHHTAQSKSPTAAPATGDVTNNSFGPLTGVNTTIPVYTPVNGTGTATPVNGTGNGTTTGGTIAAPPYVYVPPVPCAVSFVGTNGGNITGCTTSPIGSLFNPYIEPQAITGALYQPIALTTINLYPTAGVPNFYDVVEHHMDVCYEAASFAALAARQGGPAAVARAIVQTSFGAVPTYNITMYTPKPEFSPINVAVSGLQMTKANTEVLETSSTHDLNALNPLGNWATFFEKAFAKYNDVYRYGVTGKAGGAEMGYNGIGEGGAPGDVLEAFMGRPTTFFDVAANASLVADTLGQFIAGKTQAGEVVAFVTNTAANFTAGNSIAGLSASPYRCTTIAGHTYVALNVDMAARTAVIHNVWGTNPCFTSKGASTYLTNGTLLMSFDDMKRVFLQATATVSDAAPALQP